MRPYYQDSAIEIYHGDAREILPELGKVDLVLTDPPYAIGAGKGEWAATAAVAIGLNEAAKLVKDDGAMLVFSTSSGRGMEYTLGAIGKRLAFNRLLIWHKDEGTSKAAGPFKWDLVSILAFGRATFGSADRSSMIQASEPRAGREHRSQVPRAVAEWLYGPFSRPGLVTVDPFMGSGRLLEPAAFRLQRCIGIEVDERHCELAVRRLKAARDPHAVVRSEVAQTLPEAP